MAQAEYKLNQTNASLVTVLDAIDGTSDTSASMISVHFHSTRQLNNC